MWLANVNCLTFRGLIVFNVRFVAVVAWVGEADVNCFTFRGLIVFNV